jgi:plastocyanin
MRLEHRGRWVALGTVVLGFACGGKGGGGTGPCTPGAATQLVKNGGDAQPWYFNNPLPAALSVKALDANNCAVPGVVVNWAVAPGAGGAVTPAQSTTNSSGIASATDSIGSTSPQKVTATFTGLATPDTFTVTASAPSTTGAVSLKNIAFNPASIVIQSGGTVTWTWNDNPTPHNVTFTSGPAPRPADSPPQMTTGTYDGTFTTPGTYGYHCTIHGGMSGTVTVVH